MNASDTVELDAMKAHVTEHGCRWCKSKDVRPTGRVNYTSPLDWQFKCASCARTMYLSYVGFGPNPEIEIHP